MAENQLLMSAGIHGGHYGDEADAAITARSMRACRHNIRIESLPILLDHIALHMAPAAGTVNRLDQPFCSLLYISWALKPIEMRNLMSCA